MESIKQNLGVDISKDTFSACFMSLSKDFKMEEHGSKSLSNSLTGFEQMLAWITPLLNPVSGVTHYDGSHRGLLREPCLLFD